MPAGRNADPKLGAPYKTVDAFNWLANDVKTAIWQTPVGRPTLYLDEVKTGYASILHPDGASFINGSEHLGSGKRGQLKVKQADFLKQQVRRGEISVTPLKDLVYETANVQEYVVESPRRDAQGLLVSEGRVLTSEIFAKACDGILELTDSGEVVYKACFAAGTLVHNNRECGPEKSLGNALEIAQIEGECFVGDTLISIEPWVDSDTGKQHQWSYIEDIKVGDEVLSRCEITGEMAYKRVTKVYTHGYAKVSIIACDYGPEYFAKFGPQANNDGIITTANHPFWVEGKGWTKVCDLQAGDEFLTYNGVKATFRIASLDAFEAEVYNLEVEDFHTYFVESAGIWVHNKNLDVGV